MTSARKLGIRAKLFFAFAAVSGTTVIAGAAAWLMFSQVRDLFHGVAGRNIPEIVEAVTKYLGQRLIERERALADGSLPAIGDLKEEARLERRRRRRRGVKAFVLGLLAGCAILIAAALLFGPKP